MTSTERALNWSVFRLPKSHWHAQLESFSWAQVGPPSLRTRVERFVAEVLDGAAPHLLLTGTPGIGKSHLGVGVYRAVSAALGTRDCIWLNVPRYCDEVKRAYGGAVEDPWPDVEAARRLVVLDDLFGRDLTTHDVGQVVARLLDTAYTNDAALLVSMNPPAEELAARLHSHEVSRLLAGSTIIPIRAAQDYRRRRIEP